MKGLRNVKNYGSMKYTLDAGFNKGWRQVIIKFGVLNYLYS
jgi:hypothetical protein